jgi:hypothetical protein
MAEIELDAVDARVYTVRIGSHAVRVEADMDGVDPYAVRIELDAVRVEPNMDGVRLCAARAELARRKSPSIRPISSLTRFVSSSTWTASNPTRTMLR